MSYETQPLVPKHPDGQLRVLAIGRLSKPKATEELIASGDIDLLIAEDLSRIYRSARHQHVIVDDCIDAGVRLICVADRIDTADEDWESAMGVASFRHTMPVVDARRRQGRKNVFAFHGGGNVQKVKYGYRKLTREAAASGKNGPSGLRIAKVRKATRTIKKMRNMLMTKVNGEYSYTPLLDWLVETRVPVGRYVKSRKWSQRVVKDLLTDPILIGMRRFRTMLFTRVRRTGKFRRHLNPNGPETEHYSKLAHLTDDEFVTMQEVINEIAKQNSNRSGPEHPLHRKPRKDAIFPRQRATCSICGGLMYAYDSDQIKCENSHKRGEHQCWNHVQVNMEVAQQKFVHWLIGQFDRVDGLRPLLVDFAVEELQVLRARHDRGRSGRHKTIAQLEREAANIARAIRVGGELESFVKEAQEIEEQLRTLRELEQHSVDGENSLPACCSPEEVDRQLDDVLLHLSATSYQFSHLMREIIPQFEIVPAQAIDSGLVRPRARITLSVERLRKGSDDGPRVPDVQVELDLFDLPKHFRHVDACLEIKRDNPKFSYPKIADAINERLAQQTKEGKDPESISYMTVKRCFSIARQMEAEGLTEPYRVLTEKPEYASRWKPRRKNAGASDDAA